MNTLNSDFETKLRTPSLLASDDESTMGWLVVHSDFESSEKYIQTLLNYNHSYLDPFKCLHSSIRFVDLIEFALLKRIEKLFYWEDLYKSLDNWTGTMTSFQVNLAITGHFFISFIFSKQSKLRPWLYSNVGCHMPYLCQVFHYPECIKSF